MTPSSVSGSPVLSSIERLTGYKGEPEDVEGEVCRHSGEGRAVDLKVCSYTRTLSQIAITDPL